MSKKLVTYGVAVGSVSIAGLLTHALWPWLEPHPTSTFLAAVTVTAWYGGLRPSLVATALAILVEDYFFIAPVNSLEFTLDNVVRICVFVMVALLISWIDSARKNALADRDRLLSLEHEARTTAETANRAKDEFLGMVSHELRTPLNVILGWVAVVRSGKLNPETISKALDTIERNAKLQQKLIDDLIDVSRIAAGKLRIEPRLVDLRQVVEDGVSVVMLSANAKSIDVRVLDPGEKAFVVGDPHRLQQVVWNLLSNAIKFTPERGRIELIVTKAEHSVRLTVCDSGRGIDADLLPYVFEPFRHGENDGNNPAGIGLGLSIVRHIVELHGGSVHATSGGRDRGATFTVDLPLASQEALETPGPAEPRLGALETAPRRAFIAKAQ